jgi:hypothetical protein
MFDTKFVKRKERSSRREREREKEREERVIKKKKQVQTFRKGYSLPRFYDFPKFCRPKKKTNCWHTSSLRKRTLRQNLSSVTPVIGLPIGYPALG